MFSSLDRRYSLRLFVVTLLLFASGCPTQDPSTPDEGDRVDRDTRGDREGGTTADVDSGEPKSNQLRLPVDLPNVPSGKTAPWPEDPDVVHGGLYAVEYVIDGDTLVVSTGTGSETGRVRLKGIDAPECNKSEKSHGRWSCDPSNRQLSGDGEYFGVEAWRKLEGAVEGAVVRIACKTKDGACETDIYDRFLAWVVVDGSTDMSLELAESGRAWTYTSFPTDNLAVYCRGENRARSQGRGMWAHPAKIKDALNDSTKRWYRRRDAICRDATKN